MNNKLTQNKNRGTTSLDSKSPKKIWIILSVFIIIIIFILFIVLFKSDINIFKNKSLLCQEIFDKCDKECNIGLNFDNFQPFGIIKLDEFNSQCKCNWELDEKMDYCSCLFRALGIFKDKNQMYKYVIPRDSEIIELKFDPEPDVYYSPSPLISVVYKDGILLRYNKEELLYSNSLNGPGKISDFCEIESSQLENSSETGKTRNTMGCWNYNKYYNDEEYNERTMSLNFYGPEINRDYFEEEAKKLLEKLDINNYKFVGDFDQICTMDPDISCTYVIIDNSPPPYLIGFVPLNVKNYDSSICDKLIPEKKRQCYNAFAFTYKNESYCDKIENANADNLQGLCYKTLALYKNDTNICKKINFGNLNKTCMDEVEKLVQY